MSKVTLKWTKELDPKKTTAEIFDKQAKLFISSTLAKYMDPYVPFDTGKLSNTILIDETGILYNVDYAERVYYGKDFNFQKTHHPLAAALWDEVTMAHHKDQVMQEIEKYIESRG